METDRQWSSTMRLMALVGLAIFAIVVAYIARGTLNLIFFALIIAYLLSPLVKLFVRINVKRPLAILFSYLILLVLVILLFSLIFPLIGKQVQLFLDTDWVTVMNQIDNWLQETIRELEVNNLLRAGNLGIDLSVPLTELRKSLNSIDISNFNVAANVPDFSDLMASILSVSANVIGRVMATGLAFITAIMASIHFCNDGWKLKGLIVRQFTPNYQPEISELISRLWKVWNNYFVGELKLMLIIGVTTTIVCMALGLRWAIVLGIVAGFLEVVPNIGPILACFPAIFSAAIFGSRWLPLSNFMMVLVVIAAYILIQQLENILVVPRVMGDALEIHPVMVILGILVLSSRLGIFGALLASPLIGLLRVVLKFVIAKLRCEDPYPEIYQT